MKNKYFYAVIVLLAVLLGCNQKSDYSPVLAETLDSYLTALQEKNWDYLYSIQTDEFRQLRPYKYFVRQMDKDIEVTQIKGYIIKRGVTTGGIGALEVVYEMTSDLMIGHEGKVLKYKTEVTFAQIDQGKWKLQQSGLEAYYPFLNVTL